MEKEKEKEVRKDSFLNWKEEIRNSNIFRRSNRIGKNLSYVAYMSAWHRARRALLKEIIDELNYECNDVVICNIYNKFDSINEEIINYEKI